MSARGERFASPEDDVDEGKSIMPGVASIAAVALGAFGVRALIGRSAPRRGAASSLEWSWRR